MKKIKTIIAVLLTISFISCLFGCDKHKEVEAISYMDFKNAIQEFYGVEDEIYENERNDSLFMRYSPNRAYLVTLQEYVDDEERNIKARTSQIRENFIIIQEGHPYYGEVEVEDVIFEYDDDISYIVFTTTDEEFIHFFYPTRNEVDRLYYASYCIGYTWIEVFTINDDINEAMEFVDSLGLPNL